MKNYSVLIIDDSIAFLSIIENFLIKITHNISIIKASNGKEAYILAEKHLPDLIISDWEMPVMNGIETIKLLKANKLTENIPVIMCSGKMTSSENLNTALEAGAVDYIRKPIDKVEFTARVNSMLKLSTAYKKNIQQNKQLRKQKNELIKTHKKITDSINYAKRIQTAIFPPKEVLNSIVSENFLFFRPKEIVSGDFYWTKQLGDYHIIAVADCTGHGIPGAFMSMLGISILNKTTTDKNAMLPNIILTEMSTMLRQLLRQNENEMETLDGIDISLVSINQKQNTLYFAGANNHIVRIANNELNLLMADDSSVGFNFGKEIEFTNNEIYIKPGDQFYLFSDGYKDQFGGEKGTCYLSKNFNKLLLDIHNEPMEKQEEILSLSFDNWKGKQPQVDDVLVVGIKI